MSLENWAINRWLEKLESDREEIERLLANADGHLDDYQKAVASEMSTDAQLSLAYDAIRASATAALRATGYRVVRGGGEHYRTIEALEFSIDPERKLIPKLDALRRKRNTGAYDDYGLVSQGEADLAGKLAAQVRKDVEDWIRTNHAEKITQKPIAAGHLNVGALSNLEVHHRESRSQSGDDAEQNLITLCTRCHSIVHRGTD